MKKCDKCNKTITKRSPGLECSRCEKLVHGNTLCSGLSNKQLTALRAAENLEWTCEECHKSSPKRPSFYVPQDDGDDEDAEGNYQEHSQINVKQFLRDISVEMEKTMKKEVKELTKSLQFHSDKMDEVMESIEAFKQTITDLKRKNTELTNKNSHLETRIQALEQQFQSTEQQKYANHLEIANVPFNEKEDTSVLIEKIAKKLQLSTSEIESSKRLPGKPERPGSILIKTKGESIQTKWLASAKTTTILVTDVMQNVSNNNEKIYIREALTPYNKMLLWNAKQELKSTYKFIWCKRGIIRARKDEESRTHILRSTEDIKKLKI